MATARSRIQKGRNFQSKIMQLIKECFKLDDYALRTPVGSENGPDIIYLNKQVSDTIGLSIECKNQKSISIWASLEQVKANQKKFHPNNVPALVFHRSLSGNPDVWIAVPLEHYLKLRGELL
jgi:hypothetical protein